MKRSIQRIDAEVRQYRRVTLVVAIPTLNRLVVDQWEVGSIRLATVR